VRYQFTSLIMLASLGACAAPVSSSEEATGQAAQATTAALNTGQYQINPSYALNECVSTANTGTGNGAVGDIWTCATSGDPDWAIVQVSSGVYEIHQAASGECLTVNAGLVNTDSTSMVLWTCKGQVGSRFNVTQVGSNYTFNSIDNTGMCLDVVGAHSSDGTAMDLYKCDGHPNQQFRLTPSVSATLAVTQSGSQYTATITVTNSSTTKQNNWQVGLNLNQSNIGQNPSYGGVAGIINGEVVYNNGLAVVTPTGPEGEGEAGATLSAGASTQVSFTGTITGSNWTPTIAEVDGVAGSFAPVLNNGIDNIAQAVATAALNVITGWEAGRTTNTLADFPLLDSHSYVVSGTQIVFDTNSVAGSIAPAAAVSALASAQADPATASYLVSGLLSCFADASSQYTYAFNGAALRGWSYTTTGQNVTVGTTKGTDNIYRVGSNVNGAEQIALTETVNSGSEDYNFGLVSTILYDTIDNNPPVYAKYHSGNGFPCSPFNGPGGSANPYLVISVNGNSVGARQQLPTDICPSANHCTSTAVLDPVAYASPGQFYDANGNLLGPPTNPFALAPNVVLGYNPDHQGQWSQDVSGNWGEFSKKTFSGGAYWYKWSMCAGGAYSSNGC
jgi:hypothetical protein